MDPLGPKQTRPPMLENSGALCIRKERKRGPGWGFYWLATGLVVAAGILLQPYLSTWAARTQVQEKSPKSRKIEEMRVGDRVLAISPTNHDEPPFSIDPATWRRIALRTAPSPETEVQIVMLRSLSWLEEKGALSTPAVDIEVPECGIAGKAQIVAIDPCPPIKRGRGRVVTATFRHSAADVIDLYLSGSTDAIGTTHNHPFWSEDRTEFVPAGELRPGERLRGITGMPTVIKVVPRAKREPVYNLEVEGLHVYHVSPLGVLVHNAGIQPFPLSLFEGGTKGLVYTYIGEVNGKPQYYVGSTADPNRPRKEYSPEVTKLLQQGKNLSVTVQQVDITDADAVAAKNNITKDRAVKRILRNNEEQRLRSSEKITWSIILVMRFDRVIPFSMKLVGS